MIWLLNQRALFLNHTLGVIWYAAVSLLTVNGTLLLFYPQNNIFQLSCYAILLTLLTIPAHAR